MLFSMFLFLQFFSSDVVGQEPGTLKWEFLTGDWIDSSPAIDDSGTIYVGSFDGKLYAINPGGTKKWEFLIDFGGLSSPAIGTDGTIYIGTEYSGIFAINPDGTKKWEFVTEGMFHSSPAIGIDGTIYIGSMDDTLYAINPDGTRKWEFITAGAISSSPAIGLDGTIYIGSWDKKLYAINTDGTKKWSYLTGGRIEFSSPAIGSDGTIYIGSTDSKLYAIDPLCKLKWSFLTGGQIKSSPTIGSDGVIYIGSWDHKLYAINPDGTKKWECQFHGIIEASPAIGKDGTIYVGSSFGSFYAINSDGTEKWLYFTYEDIDSSPAISDDGTIYVGCMDNKVYAFNSDCGGLASGPWPKFRNNEANNGLFTGLNCTVPFNIKQLDLDSPYELTVDIVHNEDGEVIISDFILTETNDYIITSTLPLSIPKGNLGYIKFKINPDSTAYYRNKFEFTYMVNSDSGNFSGEAPVAIFINDQSETAYIAEKAIDAYNSAKNNDEYISLTNNTGVIYRLLCEYDIAERYFQNAIDSSLTRGYGFGGIKMNLGVVNSDLALSTEANDLYDEAYADISSDESNSALAPQIYYNRAWEHYILGEFSNSRTKALETINHLMTNDFLMAKAYVLLGASWFNEGDSTAAIENFQNAIDIDPTSCIADIAEKNLWVATSVIDEKISIISIYPNPNNGSFILRMHERFTAERVKLRLYNSSGQLVINRDLYYPQGSTEFYIDATELESGFYHLLMIDGKKMYNETVIIQK